MTRIMLALGCVAGAYVFLRGLLGVGYELVGWVLKTFFGYEEARNENERD